MMNNQDEIKNLWEKIETKMDSLENKFQKEMNSLGSRFQTVENKMNSLGGEFQTMKNEVNSLRDELRGIKDKTEFLEMTLEYQRIAAFPSSGVPKPVPSRPSGNALQEPRDTWRKAKPYWR